MLPYTYVVETERILLQPNERHVQLIRADPESYNSG